MGRLIAEATMNVNDTLDVPIEHLSSPRLSFLLSGGTFTGAFTISAGATADPADNEVLRQVNADDGDATGPISVTALFGLFHLGVVARRIRFTASPTGVTGVLLKVFAGSRG